MNHTKKMILVPQESVARLHDTPTSSPQIQMSALDTEMSYIMRKQYADDSEKWKKYNEALQRYLYFANESRKPLEISLALPDEKKETESPIRQQLELVMPKTYRAQALRIFDYLKDSKVTWDSSGTVTINGQGIPHSNIIELISDLTRSRRHFEPTGVTPFIQALAHMNFPLDLIGNEKRRATVRQAKQTGSGITVLPSGRVSKGRKNKIMKRKHVWKSW
jgi:hypothetical protein